MSKALSMGTCSAITVAFMLAGISNHAYAFEFDDGPITGSIDTTLSYGISTRLDNPDKAIVCTANGGNAFGCNTDDGNLNYEKGTIGQVFKFTTDIELNHKTSDLGAFFRVKGFVDKDNNNNDDTERTLLSDKAIDLVGENIDLLDAYAWKRFEISDRSAEVRFGKHVLNWGESTFIQGGINAINPIDAAAIRLPGAELREALLPVNMLSMSADVTDTLSVEGFYQIDWDKTIPDPSGSYFSTNDFATDGGSMVQLGFGSFSDLGRAAGPTFETAFIQAGIPAAGAFALASALDLPAGVGIETDLTSVGLGGIYLADNNFLDVSRASDEKPSDDGQWGVSMRYFSEELNDTEFGFYYMNYHSRLPLISANTGSATGVTAGTTALLATAGLVGAGTTAATLAGAGAAAAIPSVAGAVGTNVYAKTASYLIEYPEDIQLLGVSFNTNAGLWALQGEYSFKDDVPLQIDDVELLFSALTPLGTSVAAATGGLVTLPYATNQVGVFGTDTYIPGYIERDVSQMQATATRIFPNIMGADSFVLVAEAAVTHVHNMPSKNTLRLNGPGTFTSGDASHAAAGGGHSGKAAEDSDHFADATSWGYRLAGRWTFNNVYKAVALTPRVAWQHDVDGVTPGPGGNFIEGRQAVTLGMTATYKNQWAADVGYTSFGGAGRHNLLRDRDFISANIKYSF